MKNIIGSDYQIFLTNGEIYELIFHEKDLGSCWKEL